MVKLNRIYTRTGDDGTTALVGSTRVQKCSPRVEAYGELDELNAWCGLVRSTLLARTDHRAEHASVLIGFLEMIQNELFDIGAELATPTTEQKKHLPAETGERLEEWIDELNRDLPELRSFVLPGGSEVACMLHVARTVCRRAERHLVALASHEHVHTSILVYVNRLSDLLFVMSRYDNRHTDNQETLWVPEKRFEPKNPEDSGSPPNKS